MAEDAFGEGGTGYSQQEPNGAVCGSEISQRLMAHMFGLEAPGVDPLPYYYFVAGDSSQAPPLTYPSSAEFTNGMQAMNSVAMSGGGTGAVGGNWSHNMADNYGGINNTNYAMYDFGEYGV